MQAVKDRMTRQDRDRTAAKAPPAVPAPQDPPRVTPKTAAKLRCRRCGCDQLAVCRTVGNLRYRKCAHCAEIHQTVERVVG